MSDKLEQVLQKQKQQIEEPTTRDKEEVEQLVGFIVGEEEFAIPILYIKEIIKPIEYTRVPSVPDYVLGVFNLRGSVIPLIDLRIKFNLNPTKMTANTRYIVMKDDDNIAGFVIDRLTEAIRINKNRIDQPPETLARDKGMIQGIGKRDNNILTILKVEALLKRDF
ncbi:purine-binding chemotaxis protein CheW [Campylobacter hyointestinalis]|uniref:Purine-binding chemotaxis protein CheW n=1 Tax=Campylobacter hyointestinalis subsp. hyointestinalis TaxID=91352 RepID=A0A0S4SW18_CAMHY|nr:chemotaxis protein CheW [Campylobacter hyointestinalis]PPB53198.1 chemotaxis protein CheW [Campylobacter hyointestinalis subsp. hyointestinalis]PPB55291.1 chemotaxis protein CheW [Campylobacter hyointestinalis subsp. hyointestinalis]PPB62479.1 chemotaxis protein CheW [Campylobacter hyointestinalis subsp. hyointestinalis]PPB64129.1 chemotaxis protein CheW [Campylobacter hyointestinalis subsp. hyointestinalis]PPB66582.1 chemotaxis protein CheW [Campylobacter hyointestinalis subsp. hyointestin